MYYGSPKTEKRLSQRLPHLFSFHHQDRVLVGRDICRNGLGLYCPSSNDGTFLYRHLEKLKKCYVQIHGVTVYFSELKVVRLERIHTDFIYGLEIVSMVPQEKEKFLAVYESKLADYEAGKLKDPRPRFV